MRKITEEALNAFITGRPMKKQNTEVRVTSINSFQMLLHGNIIAERRGNKLHVRNCGWETSTTKERLNAVLNHYKHPNICVRQFVMYIGSEPMGNKTHTFKI